MAIEEAILTVIALADREGIEIKSLSISERDYARLLSSTGGKISKNEGGTIYLTFGLDERKVWIDAY